MTMTVQYQITSRTRRRRLIAGLEANTVTGYMYFVHLLGGEFTKG